MYMKNFLDKFVLSKILYWFIFLLVILLFSVNFVKPQRILLGGGYDNYIKNPYLFAFGNFDGEHYASIAKRGYVLGERAFFPLYPGILYISSKVFGSVDASVYFSGIVVSLVSFCIGLIGLYRLVKEEFDVGIAKLVVVLTLVFPTSFFFASVYTEGLFFALLVWSFYFARKGQFIKASIVAAFLTATRFVGVIIIPIIIWEWYQKYSNKKQKTLPWFLVLPPLGLLVYMVYLNNSVGDPFAFYNNMSIFGEQRSSHPILLPQVIYRYIFKILPSINLNYFPVLFVTFLEFFIGIGYLFLTVFSFFKLPFSYSVLLAAGYVIPTLSGSFSSMPRYVLVLFPAYIMTAVWLRSNKKLTFAFISICTILLIISFTLFSRGYWIS